MLNPNICKFVTVTVEHTLTPANVRQSAIYKAVQLPVYLHKRTLQPGKRKLYLKYSISSDGYYLSDRG